MTHPHNEPPVHPVPPIVVALFLVLLAVEAVFSLGEAGLVGGQLAVGWRTEYIQRFGFSGVAFDWMLANNRWPLEHVIRFLSYIFVHGSFYHALFAMVFILAMGKIVTEAVGPVKFLLIFFGSALVGAVAFGVLTNDPWLVGAYPPAYGLIGGFSYLLWLNLKAVGGPQYRAFTLIGFLMAIQLLFGLLFGGGRDWVADLAGFFAGFLLTALLVPGGWARILEKLRGRA
jgi:membrane associated rhomboid family serine protease